MVSRFEGSAKRTEYQDCQVLSLEWQSCSRLQRSHLGLRASQTWRPWWMIWWEKSIQRSLGMTRINSCSTF